MPASTEDVMAEMVDQIYSELSSDIDGLQVVVGRIVAPTPPTIEVFPPDDEPFYERSGMGGVNYNFVFIVRARVTTADQPTGQRALLRMMDPNRNESVARALESDTTLNGKAQDVTVDAPTNYGQYSDPAHREGLLGCTWRTVVTV